MSPFDVTTVAYLVTAPFVIISTIMSVMGMTSGERDGFFKGLILAIVLIAGLIMVLRIVEPAPMEDNSVIMECGDIK